ncbi:MAG: molecular chaperone TorD family protein [Betaproteobacteria bacterium]|nr:molecular chaperone TorD family protein [Betaproteobacteria bacterium]
MSSSREMQLVAAGRAKTYAVLAALYSAPPTEELAATIRAGGLTTEGGSRLADATDALTACFRQMSADGVSVNDLAAEYTHVFVLPSGVTPHESYYADENRRIGGHVTAAVKSYYDAAAAQLTEACLELPDHMGVEFEFMKFLCDIEAQLWQEPDRDGLRRCLTFQSGFLADHLLRWHRALGEKIIDVSNLALYRALARLSIEFLEAERTFVPELTTEICSEGRTACLSES